MDYIDYKTAKHRMSRTERTLDYTMLFIIYGVIPLSIVLVFADYFGWVDQFIRWIGLVV